MFLKSTLTVPKIKDLVNSSNQKYQNIFNTISHNTNTKTVYDDNPNSYTNIDLLPSDSEENSMKNELKSFLKKQLNNNDKTDNIVAADSSPNHFSNF